MNIFLVAGSIALIMLLLRGRTRSLNVIATRDWIIYTTVSLCVVGFAIFIADYDPDWQMSEWLNSRAGIAVLSVLVPLNLVIRRFPSRRQRLYVAIAVLLLTAHFILLMATLPLGPLPFFLAFPIGLIELGVCIEIFNLLGFTVSIR